MKAAEAALFAVALLGIVVISSALLISASRRTPERNARLEAAQAEAERLAGEIESIYGYVSAIRDTDPVADYIAGEIERYRRAAE